MVSRDAGSYGFRRNQRLDLQFPCRRASVTRYSCRVPRDVLRTSQAAWHAALSSCIYRPGEICYAVAGSYKLLAGARVGVCNGLRLRRPLLRPYRRQRHGRRPVARDRVGHPREGQQLQLPPATRPVPQDRRVDSPVDRSRSIAGTAARAARARRLLPRRRLDAGARGYPHDALDHY